MNKLKYIIIALVIITGSCTPKVAETVVETPPVKETPKVYNPCLTLDELSPGANDEVSTAYVLYKDLSLIHI